MSSSRYTACMAFVVAAATLPDAACPQSVNVEVRSTRESVQSRQSHWIGIACGEIGEDLRAHLDLPKEQGVIVREVFPGSAADKAGLRKHDILLAAGKVRLESPASLRQVVQKANGRDISLEILRKGRKLTIQLAPRQRTGNQRLRERTGKVLQSDADGPQAEVRKRLEQFRKQKHGRSSQRPETGAPGSNSAETRVAASLPDGVSVSISKINDQPARIQVKRGKDSWDVTENELDSLPADLQSGVRAMLDRNGAATIRLQLNGVPAKQGGTFQDPRRGAQIFRRGGTSQNGLEVDVKDLVEQIRRLTEKVENLEKQQRQSGRDG